MTSVLRELSLSYAVLSEGHRRGSASAVHEPSPADFPDRGSSIAPAGPSIVAERDWEPLRPRFAHDQIVGIRVAFADVAVRQPVKRAGGTWNPERRVWQLRYDRVVALGLNSRIVDELASNSGCPGSSGEHLPVDARAPSR